MKTILIALATALLFASCAGDTEKTKPEMTVETPTKTADYLTKPVVKVTKTEARDNGILVAASITYHFADGTIKTINFK